MRKVLFWISSFIVSACIVLLAVLSGLYGILIGLCILVFSLVSMSCQLTGTIKRKSKMTSKEKADKRYDLCKLWQTYCSRGNSNLLGLFKENRG